MQNAPYIAAGLSDADMLWLLSVGKLRRFEAGAQLVVAGKPVDDLYFVVSGLLAVMLDDGTRLAQLHQGDVVGEMSFVERHSSLVSVVAEQTTEMLAIPRKLLLERFEQDPVFAARVYRALAVFLSERLRETTAVVRATGEDGLREKADKAARERFAKLFSKSGP